MSPISNDTNFSQPTRAAWQELAETTLKGRSVDTLNRVHEDGISIDALYSSSTHAIAMPDHISAQAARHWVIAQYIEAADNPSVLNTMIMDELTGGTERLIFASGQKINIVPDAMEGVMADAIILSFDNPSSPVNAIDVLVNIWNNQNVGPTHARGSVGAVITTSTCADMLALMAASTNILDQYPSLNLFKISGAAAHRDGASVAQELAFILAQFTMMMRMSEQMELSLDDVMARLEIDVTMDADIYGGIAKARALRSLMARMQGVMNISCSNMTAKCHGITSDRMLTLLDPETNMLRGGTAMLSMALSGLGVMTNRPHNWLTGSTPLSRRIARNAHHLLADEAQLNHIADPAQGSYYIDRLTHDLSEKAWQLFQEIEREGGLEIATETGLISAWYKAASAQRNDHVNKGDDAILGVSIHPVSSDDIPQDIIVEPGHNAPMPRGGHHRPASSWEELRRAFKQLKARCLLLDSGAGDVNNAKRWMDALGLEAAVMTTEDTASSADLIAAAAPDIVVLGADLTIEADSLSQLTPPPLIRKSADFKGDVIAEMTHILTSLKERGAS